MYYVYVTWTKPEYPSFSSSFQDLGDAINCASDISKLESVKHTAVVERFKYSGPLDILHMYRKGVVF